jgi:hypothetical protein
VFKAIESTESAASASGLALNRTDSGRPQNLSQQSPSTPLLQHLEAYPAAQLIVDLIREWMDFYELDYTNSTLAAEARLVSQRAILTLHSAAAEFITPFLPLIRSHSSLCTPCSRSLHLHKQSLSVIAHFLPLRCTCRMSLGTGRCSLSTFCRTKAAQQRPARSTRELLPHPHCMR